jgi:hypothetical protein
MIRRRNFRQIAAALLLAMPFVFSSAHAHEVRPAYLEIKETVPGQFSLLWRTPVLAGMRLPVALKLPDDVRNLKEPVVQELTDSLVERRWIEAGPKGLAGKHIEFPGLQLTITDVLVRYAMLDGREGTAMVVPAQPWLEIAAAQSWLGVAGTYVGQGVLHILFGVDLRLRPASHRQRPMDAVEDDHGVHGCAQHYLGDRNTRVCQRAGRPAQRRHRPKYSISWA